MLQQPSLSSLLLNNHHNSENSTSMQKPSGDLPADPTLVNLKKHDRDQVDEEKLDSKKSRMNDEGHGQKHPAQGDEKSLDASDEGSDEHGGNESDDSEHDMFKKFRREKRLAMNRASARARRRKKKVMLETLTHQVTELTKKNISLQGTNETLIRKVERLEASLGQARETIASLLEGRQNAAAAASVLPSSLSPSLLPGTAPTGLVGSGRGTAGAAALGAGHADPYHSLLFGAGAGTAAATGSLFAARDPVYAAALQQQRVQQMLALRAGAAGGLLPDDTSTFSSSLMRSPNQPNASLAGSTEGGIQSALRLAQIPGAAQGLRENLNDDSEGRRNKKRTGRYDN